ncbi:possible roles in filamentous growth, cell polarity, and cellular elongation [Scheffersomyces stipitis CBS 6054]|uniref:Polyprenal reductase n=1 Tax=Scheffersomyces stipitis (strain ATCC 58785 / CBS 6054 / NBRC 10063 / NRRL Y-11545) TaxID=322104 RepID=A3LTZ8_PICST|nr:possible roles in filamentous growth, cell polarity, and cellular elongation [Scheffersomyces stipitis CBS 6054]ABN66154.2 possible roles in filamentous growth, cell polarity, and cellular elongation [Scheffersomyces stipitis CBS 6054]KAG2732716.1 hypothetical protein G9P44_003706 [Scheffersomyces stipitis]
MSSSNWQRWGQLPDVSLYHIVLGGYVFMTANVLLVKFIKPLNSLLLYGKNRAQTTGDSSENAQNSKSILSKLIDDIFNLTVPKAWFSHYYVSFFVYCTLIQIVDIYKAAPVTELASNDVLYKSNKLIHIMLWIQSTRRTLECFTFTKFAANSKINFSHYIVGMAFYALVSLNSYVSLKELHPIAFSEVWKLITTADVALFAIFLAASFDQFRNHYHLATLVKYTIPYKFKLVASPHYTDEIIIYSVVAAISCKESLSSFASINYLSCLIFTVVNLSVTSVDTYKYYQQKFGDKFKLQWAILPGIL